MATEYYLLPAVDSEDGTPVAENLRRWLDRNLWGIEERTRYRAEFQREDRVCFYAKGSVVAEATLDSGADRLPPEQNPGKVPVQYGLRLKDVRWHDKPVPISEGVRSKLSAFKNKPLDRWAWFVRTTWNLAREDFNLLTGKSEIT